MTTLVTTVNRKRKEITTWELTHSLVKEISQMLVELFPKQDKEPAYSLGFQRLISLSKNKRFNLEVSFMQEGLSQKEVKLFLEAMTEEDFKSFKRSK